MIWFLIVFTNQSGSWQSERNQSAHTLKYYYNELPCYDCLPCSYWACKKTELPVWSPSQPAFSRSQTAHFAFPNSPQLRESLPLTMQEHTLLFASLHTETYRTSHIYTILFLSFVQLFLKFLFFLISWLSDCLILKFDIILLHYCSTYNLYLVIISLKCQ